MSTAARARVYKDRDTGRWTVVKYWHSKAVHTNQWRTWRAAREHWRSWDDARACAVRWVNA